MELRPEGSPWAWALALKSNNAVADAMVSFIRTSLIRGGGQSAIVLKGRRWAVRAGRTIYFATPAGGIRC